MLNQAAVENGPGWLASSVVVTVLRHRKPVAYWRAEPGARDDQQQRPSSDVRRQAGHLRTTQHRPRQRHHRQRDAYVPATDHLRRIFCYCTLLTKAPSSPKIHSTASTWQLYYVFSIITFRVRHRGEMYVSHGRMAVCVFLCPSPHSHTTARTRM